MGLGEELGETEVVGGEGVREWGEGEGDSLVK